MFLDRERTESLFESRIRNFGTSFFVIIVITTMQNKKNEVRMKGKKERKTARSTGAREVSFVRGCAA